MTKGRGEKAGSAAGPKDIDALAQDALLQLLGQIGSINAPDLLAIKELIAKYGAGADGLKAITAQTIAQGLKTRLSANTPQRLETIVSAANVSILAEKVRLSGVRSLTAEERKLFEQQRLNVIAAGGGPTRGARPVAHAAAGQVAALAQA